MLNVAVLGWKDGKTVIYFLLIFVFSSRFNEQRDFYNGNHPPPLNI